MVPKKVAVTWKQGEKLHQLWKNFMNTPPRGYAYIDANGKPLDFSEGAGSLGSGSKLLHTLWRMKKRSAFLYMKYKEYEEKRYSEGADSLGADLVYCINGRIHRGKTPWICDFENPTAFFGFNIKGVERYNEVIARHLLDARAILPYSETGKESFIRIFGDRFKDKVEVVPNCVKIPQLKKSEQKRFTILFTGSINIRDNYIARGGRETLRAFLRLSNRYPDLHLVMRCKIPESEQTLVEKKNITVIQKPLNSEEFSELFQGANAYCLPAFIGYALSGLEAMSYSLPIITTDFLENGELINDGIEGYKVPPPQIEYAAPYIPTYYVGGAFPEIDNRFVDDIAKAMEKLYLQKKKAIEMGKSGRRRVIENHSLEAKNRILSQVFNKAL